MKHGGRSIRDGLISFGGEESVECPGQGGPTGPGQVSEGSIRAGEFLAGQVSKRTIPEEKCRLSKVVSEGS